MVVIFVGNMHLFLIQRNPFGESSHNSRAPAAMFRFMLLLVYAIIHYCINRYFINSLNKYIPFPFVSSSRTRSFIVTMLIVWVDTLYAWTTNSHQVKGVSTVSSCRVNVWIRLGNCHHCPLCSLPTIAIGIIAHSVVFHHCLCQDASSSSDIHGQIVFSRCVSSKSDWNIMQMSEILSFAEFSWR